MENWPVTVKEEYTDSGMRIPLAEKLTVETVVAWACTRSGDKSDNREIKTEKCLTMGE